MSLIGDFLCPVPWGLTDWCINILSLEDGVLMAQIFLNIDMKKNDYGETVFYKDNDDVMCGIHQRPGRVLIWNSTINHVLKPPSMLYLQTQNSLVLKLTNSVEYKKCLEADKVGHIRGQFDMGEPLGSLVCERCKQYFFVGKL